MKKIFVACAFMFLYSVCLPTDVSASINDIKPFTDSVGNIYTVERIVIDTTTVTGTPADYVFRKYDSNFNRIVSGDKTVRMENWVRFGSDVIPLGFSRNGSFWFSYYPNTGSVSNLRLMSININNPIFTQLTDMDIRDDWSNYTYGPYLPWDRGINATIIGDFAYISYSKTRISNRQTNYLLRKVNLTDLTSSNLANYDSNRGYSYGIDVDSVGNIYVIRGNGLGAYSNNKTIEKLDSNGGLLYTIAYFPPSSGFNYDIDKFGIKVTPDGRNLYLPYRNGASASTTRSILSVANASPSIKYSNYYMNNARSVFYDLLDGVPVKRDLENRPSCSAYPSNAIMGSTTVKWQFNADDKYGFLPYKFYWSDTANVINQDYASPYYGVSTQKIYSSVGVKNMSVAVEDINGNFSSWKSCPNTVTVSASTVTPPTTIVDELKAKKPNGLSISAGATGGNVLSWDVPLDTPSAYVLGGYYVYVNDLLAGYIQPQKDGSRYHYTENSIYSTSTSVYTVTAVYHLKSIQYLSTSDLIFSQRSDPARRPPTILPWTGPTSVTAGTQLSYTINWNALPTIGNQTVFVHFIDSNGTQRFVSSITPTQRTTQWLGSVSIPIAVTVPTGIPTGTYKVMAGLYNATTGARLPLTAGSGVTADSQTRYQVGTITVTTPTTPLTLSCTPSVTSATTGSTVTWNATARGGVTPYRYYFSDVANQISDNTTGSISRTYTTAGQKYMSIAIIDAANTKIDWAFCTGNVNVTAPTVVPPVVTPTTVNITINRWSGPTSVVAGNSFSYNLNWGGAPTAENETIFVHFLDSTGNMKFYNIVNPATPTKQWSGSISTPITVSVPASTPAGTYRVMVGMYVPSTTNGASGPRLPMTVGSGVIADNQTRYQVGTITVSASATGGTGSVWNAISKLFGF